MGHDHTLEELKRAKTHAKTLVLDKAGVQGVGIGDGTVRVYIKDASVARDLPDEVDGVPIEPVTVGDVTLHEPGHPSVA